MEKASPNRIIGPYILEAAEEIAWQGCLYRGYHQERQRAVHLFCIQQTNFPWLSESVWANFTDELERLLIVSHPALLAYRDIVRFHKKEIYLVTEPLQQAIDLRPPHLQALLSQTSRRGLFEKDAHAALLQILEGLQYLHAQNIIHRQLHPSLAFLDWKERPLRIKLGRFGLGALLPFEDIPVSLRPYLPIQISDPVWIDLPTQIDLYSVGAIFWEMLTGHPPPIPQPNTDPLAHLCPEHPPFARWSPLTQKILQKTLHPDINERYTRCHELLQLLRNPHLSSASAPASKNNPSIRSFSAPTSESDPYLKTLSYIESDPLAPQGEILDHDSADDLFRVSSRFQQAVTLERQWQAISPLLLQEEQRLDPKDAIDSFRPLGHFPPSRISPTERPLPPEIPERWEWEAIQQNDRLSRRRFSLLSPRLFFFTLFLGALFFIWRWCR